MAWSETYTASSRISNRVTDSISSDEHRYTERVHMYTRTYTSTIYAKLNSLN